MRDARGVLLKNFLWFPPSLLALCLINPDLLLVVTHGAHAVVGGEFDLGDPALGVLEALLDRHVQASLVAVAVDDPEFASFHTNYDDRVIVGYGYTSAAAVWWHTLHFLLSSAFHNCSFHRDLFALLVHIKW